MNDRTFSLKCGQNTFAVTVPQGVRFQYAPLNTVESGKTEAEIIRDALENPVGSPKIEELVKPGQKICIISDDNTRMTPVKSILAQLLPRIEGVGIPKEDIFIVLALGSHRHMTEAEMLEKLGSQVYENYAVYNSEFENPEMLTQVGSSQTGTPIRVYKKAMEADVRIGIGTVAPHGCMGWSGGAKILYPGITSEDIVSEFHVMQGLTDEILFGNPEAPTRLAVEEWAKSIGLHYIVNCVLDEEMKLYYAASGDYIKAQREAVKYGQQVCGVAIKEQPDVILGASYPLYMDFWQCGKATYGPARVIKKGGELLLLTDCCEGEGPHKKYLDYMSLEGGKQILEKRIQNGDTGEDLLTMAVGVSMGNVARHCHLTLITDGLNEQQCRRGNMGYAPLQDLQKTLEKALAKFEDPFLLIIPESGEAVPLVENE